MTRWLSPEGFPPEEGDEDQGDAINRQHLGSIVRGLEGESILVPQNFLSLS